MKRTLQLPINSTGVRFFSIAFICVTILNANAQTDGFRPGQLVVLRAGDGQINLRLKQAPVFVDQFDPAASNAAPSFTVAVPPKGPNAFFFNGHAATEGILTRSADRTLLAFAGYCGVDILQKPGTPSQLNFPRGICTVAADGKDVKIVYSGTEWYGGANPRAVAADGTNGFWGAGNINGTVYYDAQKKSKPVHISETLNTRVVNIIKGVLYTSINGPDATDEGTKAGLYDFLTEEGKPAKLPREATSRMRLMVPFDEPYISNAGFDINPAGTVAYVADTKLGIQKYYKTNEVWKLACNIAIPQNIPKAENHSAGCFGLAVDFSGKSPIVYATTTEGYGSVNSNRVVRVEDSGLDAPVTTIAQAMSTNIAYRGIAFTPEKAK